MGHLGGERGVPRFSLQNLRTTLCLCFELVFCWFDFAFLIDFYLPRLFGVLWMSLFLIR